MTHQACEITEEKFQNGRCMYKACHKPTGRLIGYCLSSEAAEALISAGAMFMDWDTLTGEQAESIKGGRALLEHFAAQYGVTPIMFPWAARPLWATESDLKMLEAA